MKQRIIKFRIWDNQNQIFRSSNDSSLHCISNWSIDAFDGTVVDYVCPIHDNADDAYSRNPDPGYYTKKQKIIKKPCYILQQFTGLKDSKKKDIYEGDILMVDPGKPYAYCLEVIYDDDRFILISPSREGDEYGPFMENFKLALERKTPIIVGNIFENKELLKK